MTDIKRPQLSLPDGADTLRLHSCYAPWVCLMQRLMPQPQQVFLTYERPEKGAVRSSFVAVVAFISKPSLERMASFEPHMQWAL